MRLYNSLTRKIEEFKPLNPSQVSFYACGPTVYDYTHIGHARTYVNNDLLRRTLAYLGYKVTHVMNITDVGHLTDDADEGTDKLEEGARRTGKTVWEVAKFYTDFFQDTLQKLNILPADHLVKATDHVQDMIALIKTLGEKGFTYQTDEAVYFDTSKFANYGKLSGQKIEEKMQQARKEVHVDPQKKHASDFVLWFKRAGRFKDHAMHWESPWGDGFPGWHIECSAMSIKYLGKTIDIHAGGIDHLPVHHENEIAQSEAATGKPFVNIWFHNEFLLVEGKKMSKSLQNFFTVEDVEKKGIEPLALRYLFLQTHYRKQLNFTWESAQAAQLAYDKFKETVIMLRGQTGRETLSQEKNEQIEEYQNRFKLALSEDLQLPQALAVVWEALKSNIPSTDKLDLLLSFDEVLGLNLRSAKKGEIPQEIEQLANDRQNARGRNDFKKADEIRKQIENKGYYVEDVAQGFIIKKKR